MVGITDIKVGYIIEHRKADNFISEPVDQVNIGVMQSSSGGSKISLIFSRDCLEILRETLVEVPGVAGGLQPQVLPDGLNSYRLQLASLTLTTEAVENLITGLRTTLDGLKAQILAP